MKNVYDYVIHNETEILVQNKLLAKDEAQARVLIGSLHTIDYSDPDIGVKIRPFC